MPPKSRRRRKKKAKSQGPPKQEAKSPPEPQNTDPVEDKGKKVDPSAAAMEKEAGAKAFKAKDFEGAYEHFSKAIGYNQSDHTLWANRAAVGTVLRRYQGAKEDAEKCISLKPDWAKGYARLGQVLTKMGDYSGAKKTVALGISKDPSARFLTDQLGKICQLEGGAGGQNTNSKPDAEAKREKKSKKKIPGGEDTKSGAGSASGEMVVGIDLGTTYSCVGVWRNGGVEILPNDEGSLTTPSWVAFTDEGRIVGDGAKRQAAKNPKRTLFNIKRIIGREYGDCSSDLKRMPFKVKEGKGKKPMVCVDVGDGKETEFLPEQISAMVLEKIKAIAEKQLKVPIKKAVITVPAYFNDMQRRLTKDAGAIAGLEVLRIINEPTAAALSYGLQSKTEGHILVFDLGGGTFDVSLLRIEDGVFRVLATSGDTHLGGEDFDIALTEWAMKEHRSKTSKSLFKTESAKRKLRSACEKAKRELSRREKTEIELYVDGEEVLLPVTRKKFESINERTFQRCLRSVKQVLKDSKVAKQNVTDIVLVGIVPRVREILKEYFGGKSLCCSINPDEAVAYGAAVQGAILGGVQNPTCRSLLLVDVIPISLGVGCEGNQFAVVVPRNTTVPCKRTKEFTTVQNYQTSIDIPIYEGERSNCSGNHLLGEFTITGIESAKKGEAKVDVTFELNSNGLLKVSAADKKTGAEAKVEITHDRGRLSPEQLRKLREDAAAFMEEDELRAKAWREAHGEDDEQ
ncbi:hypothetical protein AAMO2058_000864900 [Amorphochlora amoebiformis]